MDIAVISFGSLANQLYSPVYHKKLQVAEEGFKKDKSLKLPVRLGRVSSEGTSRRRITTVLSEQASTEPVFVAKSAFRNLNDAIKNLREREGISSGNYRYIGFVNLHSGTERTRIPEVARRVKKWAEENSFDAVIWTDLPTKGIDFASGSTGREIIPKLKQDPTLLKNTQDYIRTLPEATNPLQRYILQMSDYDISLVADFPERDALPQSKIPKSKWSDWFSSGPSIQGWGPPARKYSEPKIPEGVDTITWKRDRLVKVVDKFVNQVPHIPYQKHLSNGAKRRGHFPALGYGLDCSNFASWIYNYGLGIHRSSDVDDLANSRYHPEEVINKEDILSMREELQPGDLILRKGNPKHVIIYLGNGKVADSTSYRGQGVGITDLGTDFSKNDWRNPFKYPDKFILVRRPIR